MNKQIQVGIVGISLSPLYYEELILCWVKNGLGQKWSGQKWSGQKWVGSKMGRVKNGQVKNGQVKNELGQKWYIICRRFFICYTEENLNYYLFTLL